MGLFGFIKKVAKAGLSVATHGASDKVLGVLKAVGNAKLANKKRTLANQVMAMKYVPQTRTTTQTANSVLEGAASAGATYGKYSGGAVGGNGGGVGRRPKRGKGLAPLSWSDTGVGFGVKGKRRKKGKRKGFRNPRPSAAQLAARAAGAARLRAMRKAA